MQLIAPGLFGEVAVKAENRTARLSYRLQARYSVIDYLLWCCSQPSTRTVEGYFLLLFCFCMYIYTTCPILRSYKRCKKIPRDDILMITSSTFTCMLQRKSAYEKGVTRVNTAEKPKFIRHLAQNFRLALLQKARPHKNRGCASNQLECMMRTD